VPTFHNPTGVSLSLARRQALVALAADYDLLVVEDDVYRELAYDHPAPPSLWSLAPHQVIRLGSFAKSLAPGVRLGWLTGPRSVISRLADGGLLDSGGGTNHFTALVVNEFCHSSEYDRHVAELRAAYTLRRDSLLAALAAYLPPGCSWYRPEGGFFAWVMLPQSLRSVELLPYAEAAGVSFIPGPRFYLNGGGENALRLAFSLYPPALLQEGIARLGGALAAYQS
jgi:DNA-binding transcriptional MocR family regulator